jgi:GNAT superfamily N-acetyltransferase
MTEFFRRFEESKDGFWTVGKQDWIEGGIAIDGIKSLTEGAHLRWFILSPEVQGRGFGKRWFPMNVVN